MRLIARPDNVLEAGNRRCRLAAGRGGRCAAAAKREGDGASPVGTWPLRRVLYRPDRLAPPRTLLPLVPLRAHDAWCDEPGHPLYNRPVTLPFPASHERLWRDDHVYDVIVELGHNDDPPRPGLGSAIFLHVARPDYASTEGCIALALPDLLATLELADTRSVLEIQA